MKLTALAVVLLALTIVLGACGGEDDPSGPSPEEYFPKIESIFDQSAERSVMLFETSVGELGIGSSDELSRALFEAYREQFDSEEEEVVAFRDLFDARVSIQQDLIDGLGEIDPPAEVEEDHKEIVAAGREFVDLLQELNGRLAEVKSVSEVMQLLEEFDPSLTTVDDRFDSARIQLQVVSNLGHGIFINLGCGRGVGRITTAWAVASYGFDVDLGCPEVEEEPRPTATAEPDDGGGANGDATP